MTGQGAMLKLFSIPAGLVFSFLSFLIRAGDQVPRISPPFQMLSRNPEEKSPHDV
jgi:hypothetical protein